MGAINKMIFGSIWDFNSTLDVIIVVVLQNVGGRPIAQFHPDVGQISPIRSSNSWYVAHPDT